MGIDDLVNKGKDALNSEKGEEISDKGLDGAANAANKVTGDKFSDQVNQGREAADGFLGQSGGDQQQQGGGQQ